MTVKTRFAPSPTGHLHIGGARTALFSWLHARQQDGRFVLRIEDTDRERSEQGFVDAIIEGMKWLGLPADEGPVYQSARMARYQAVVEALLESGHAYRCYCSRERLDALRAEQQARKEKPRYDGRCRARSAPPPDAPAPVIRFRNPEAGEVVVEDLIRGPVRFDNRELDDLIIARSDGSPTYNFCVVVDDTDMGITHVIRGDDHLNNTPRQINIIRALGLTPPVYAHVPMILGPDGKRLSKRHGAMSVLEYREQGYLPEALINYLIRLGWSHGDQEIFSREEMLALFDIRQVHKSPAAFNPEKLLWLNQHYIKTLAPRALVPGLREQLDRLGVDPSGGPALEAVIECYRERAKTLAEMAEAARIFFEPIEGYDDKAVEKHLAGEGAEVLRRLLGRLSAVSDWQAEALHQVVVGEAEAMGLKLGKIAQPLRVALAGHAVSPPIDRTLALLGRARSLERIEQALAYLADRQGRG